MVSNQINEPSMMTLPSVSKRAVTVIRKLMLELPPDGNPDDHLPSVAWMEDSSDEREIVPAPCLGWHLKEKVPREYIVEAHGLAIAFTLPDEIREKVKDSVLDYVHGNFVFVHPNVSTWLDK
jgi:hypothetical protein